MSEASTQTRSVDPSRKWGRGVAAVLAAGVLAGTFAFATKINEPEVRNRATAELNVSCGHAKAAKFMDHAGVDTVQAMGIIVKDPSKIATVCEVVNQSLSDILLDNQANAKTNNAELYDLASSLGLDTQSAMKLVVKAQHDKDNAPLAPPPWVNPYPVTAPAG